LSALTNDFESLHRVQLRFVWIPDELWGSMKWLGELHEESRNPVGIAKHSSREFERLRTANNQTGLLADASDSAVVGFLKGIHFEDSVFEPPDN
jgi:hypothetical protein